MSEIAFIVLARAIHVMSGVTWAGAAFVLAMVIAPIMVPKGSDIPSPWLGTVARRAGALAGISAVLTVLSGDSQYCTCTMTLSVDSCSSPERRPPYCRSRSVC